MFCSRCGKDLSDEASFCIKCGAPQHTKVSEIELFHGHFWIVTTRRIRGIDAYRGTQILLIDLSAIWEDNDWLNSMFRIEKRNGLSERFHCKNRDEVAEVVRAVQKALDM